jgi:uncharacterized protein YndB with AHSA1/START domain
MPADTAFDAAEKITVNVPPAEVYAAVSDVRRMARWSAECFGTLTWARGRFVGFNRRGPFVWFTTCRVVVAKPGEEFAFDVTTFGMPVSRWGYRLEVVPSGTEVTEYWQDRRTRGAFVLGRIFTGRTTNDRPAVNRDGMRVTLERLKRELEAA